MFKKIKKYNQYNIIIQSIKGGEFGPNKHIIGIVQIKLVGHRH